MAPSPMKPTRTTVDAIRAAPYRAAVTSREELLFVPQVAPYADGPAGVHGVLEQAATATAQLADLHGLVLGAAADVRDLVDGLLARARVLALFTICETPWNDAQRTTIVRRV